MTVQLNHTIVAARDPETSARFAAEILGLPAPTRLFDFTIVQTDNGVSLDYLASPDGVTSQHYAFLVSEEEFDQIFGRILERGLAYWADPYRREAGEINHRYGGRGVYFDDPDGHLFEILTKPYGSGP